MYKCTTLVIVLGCDVCYYYGHVSIIISRRVLTIDRNEIPFIVRRQVLYDMDWFHLSLWTGSYMIMSDMDRNGIPSVVRRWVLYDMDWFHLS